MQKRNMLLVSLLPLLLAACGNQPSGTASSSTAVSSTAASAPAGSSNSLLVDVFSGNIATGKAVPLATAQTISGVIEIKKLGSVQAFDVQIGNYNNTSDGTLAVKLCEGPTCSEGSAPIAKSSDNQNFEISLTHAIDVAPGTPLHYTLTRTTGSKPFAIWTYSDANATTMMPDGSSEPRAPKIELGYRP